VRLEVFEVMQLLMSFFWNLRLWQPTSSSWRWCEHGLPKRWHTTTCYMV